MIAGKMVLQNRGQLDIMGCQMEIPQLQAIAGKVWKKEDELKPVSYTHLDVYKRQVRNEEGTIDTLFHNHTLRTGGKPKGRRT